jgi:ParB family transcriptional regulator, chromosome partitioning protein
MERRVLIVESQNEFALSMATVLRSAGYQTAMAPTAADAQRELEKRRPDLVVVRAELPDQSGFTLCGQIKKGKFGQNLRVLLLSSATGVEGLNQHRQSPAAADGYLVIPFEMGELAQMSAGIVAPPAAAAPDPDDLDITMDSALAGEAPRESAPVPPPIRTQAGGPPRLPRRERRSAINDEDRAFLDRAFQSIADRKAELLAESRQVRRTPPRREQLGTPEGKI